VPFTVSHVAAVIPFHRPLARLHVFTAAVCGSMVPDFALLTPVQIPRVQTHSIMGLFTWSLPVGLITYLLTMLLIRPAIRETLPEGAYARLPVGDAAAPLRRWSHWPLVALAILSGAVTHVAWDLFTHEDSRGTQWFPVLEDFGPEVHGHQWRITYLLQYASSGAGLLLVALACGLWWWHTRRRTLTGPRRLGHQERLLWLGAYALMPLSVLMIDAIEAPRPMHNLGYFLHGVAVDGMRWSAYGLVLISALLQIRLAVSER
jgi:Domain of unknown function (DUF4184)